MSEQEFKQDLFRGISLCRRRLLQDEPLTEEERATVISMFNVMEDLIATAEFGEDDSATTQ